MKYPSMRFILLSCLLVALLAFKFYGLQAHAHDAGSPRYPHTLSGNIQLRHDFHSKFLPTQRDLIVYLPPDYEQETTRHYPVLYMQDGQILFDAATSFFAGRERHMDERAQALINQGKIEPLIIVGIYSGGLSRKVEFMPPDANERGHLDLYGRMLIEEIRPFIEHQYRTLNDREHTALGGSSLGGLATLYLGLQYSNIFGRLAVTSPAAFMDDEMIVREVRGLRSKTKQQICLSAGSEEDSTFLDSIRDLHQALRDKGWKEDADLNYLEAAGSEHSPDDRALRVDHLLTKLFPASRHY